MNEDNFQYAMWGPSVINSVKDDALFMGAAEDAMNAVALMLYSNGTGAIQRLSTDAITVHNRFIRDFADSLSRNGIYVNGANLEVMPIGSYWRYLNHHGQPRFHRVIDGVTTEFVQCSGKRLYEHIVVSHIGPARDEFVKGSLPELDLGMGSMTQAPRSNIILVTELSPPHILLWACHPTGVLNMEECWIHTDASELILSKNISEMSVYIDLSQQPQATSIDVEIEEIEDVGT